MMAKVAAALRLLGSLKLGTPLLTASTPVNAVQPEANARSTSARTTSPPACSSAWIPNDADSATGASPLTVRTRPRASMTNTQATNP